MRYFTVYTTDLFSMPSFFPTGTGAVKILEKSTVIPRYEIHGYLFTMLALSGNNSSDAWVFLPTLG